MEKLTEEEALHKRRAHIAAWLAEHVHPAARALEELQEDAEQEIETRDYQLDAWANLWDARQAGRKRALVHLATGLGKTFVAVCDVMKFRQEWAAVHPDGTTPRVLFISHKLEINDQAIEDFRGVMPDLEIDTFTTRREADPHEVDIRFASFQSILSEMYRFDPQDYEYIIYDEAHHTEAETFRQVRDFFDPLFELALTATPRRMDEQDITEYFGAPVYSKDLAEAMAEGLLADVDYHIMLDDAVREAMQNDFEPKTLQELNELLRVSSRNEKIAEHIREEQERQGDAAKTIVFCQDVAHVMAMAEELGATAYHSGLSKRARRKILRDFRAGRIRTICTRDLFNEGVNVPDASILVFARTTGSETIYLQQLGRGLRGRNKRVTVLDFVANVERILRLRELSEEVRRHAKKLGERDEEPGGPAPDNTDSLHVHSDHADFSFDRLAIDIAEKFLALQNRGLPEGWLSIAAASVELGVGTRVVLKWADILGIELPVFEQRADGSELRGVSPETLIALREYQRTAEITEEEVRSLNSWRKTLGIAHKTLVKGVKKMGWEPLPLRPTTDTGRTERSLTSAQIAELKVHYPEIFINPVPDQWKTQNEVAELLGCDGGTIERTRKRLGWEEDTYRPPHGQPTPCYSPEQIETIKKLPEFNLEPAGSGIKSVTAVAKELNSSSGTILDVLAKHGIEPGWYTFGASNNPGKGLTEEQIAFVKPKLLQPLPPHYKRPTEVAELIGMSARVLMNRLDKLGWELPWFKPEIGQRGKPGRGFSPEQIEEVKRMHRDGELS